MCSKNFFLPVMLVALFMSANGQQLEIRPKIGIGTYSMSELKGLLAKSAEQSELGIKTVENFPSYAFYGLDLVSPVLPKLEFGLTGGFYSTGGRNHYADYSGSYRGDILTNAFNIGALVAYKDTLGNGFFYNFQLASGIKISNVTVEDELNVFEYNDLSSYDFKSNSWWIEPQVRVGKSLYKNISLSVFAGYEVNFKSKVVSKEDSQTYLQGKIDWSGIRAGLSVSYCLGL